MQTAISQSVKYVSYADKRHKEFAIESLRHNFGRHFLEELRKLEIGNGNIFTVRLIEEFREVGHFSFEEYPTNPLEEEFRITALVETAQASTIYISKLDYDYQKSSMPKWLKWILRKLYPDG